MARRMTLLLAIALVAGLPTAQGAAGMSAVGIETSAPLASAIDHRTAAQETPRLLRRAPEVRAPKLHRNEIRTPEIDLPEAALRGVSTIPGGPLARGPGSSKAASHNYPPLPGPASALNYSVEVFSSWHYEVLTGVVGLPLDIDGDGDDIPDATLELVGAPPASALGGPQVRQLDNLVFRAVVTKITRHTPVTTIFGRGYGMWINYFTNSGTVVYSVGFNAPFDNNPPDVLDISVTASPSLVSMAVNTVGPHGPLTLMGRKWEGGGWWPVKMTGYVKFDPMPPTVSFNLIPTSANRGNATVTVSSPTHVSASFVRDDPDGGNTSSHRFGVDLPSINGFLGIAWNPDPIGGERATTVQVHVDQRLDVSASYSHHILTPTGGDVTDLEAIAVIQGLQGLTSVRMVGSWPYLSTRIEPTVPIGSIEVGVGIGVPAEMARVAYDYVNAFIFGGGRMLFAARITGLKSAVFTTSPGVYELILDHAAGPLSFYYSDGVRVASGSVTLPDRLDVVVDTNSSAAELKQMNPPSGPITNINLYLRGNTVPLFGRVWQGDVYISNLDPGTRLGAGAGSNTVALSLTAGAAITLVDVHLRSDANALDRLPAGQDGVLLHDTNRFVAHLRLSGLKSISAWSKLTSECPRTCSFVRVWLNRSVNTALRFDLQSIETYKVLNIPIAVTSSTLVTVDSPPKDVAIAAYTSTRQVCPFAGVCSDEFVGSRIFYDANEPSGRITLTKDDGIGGRTFAKIASLPATPAPPGHALEACLFYDTWCGDPFGLGFPADMRLSGYVKAASPITLENLDLCLNGSCSSGAQLRATNVTGKNLSIAYAEHDNGILPNTRWIYVDTGGSANAISGDVQITGLPLGSSLNAALRNIWAAGRIMRLTGFSRDYLLGSMGCGAGTNVLLTGFDGTIFKVNVNVTGLICP